MERLGRHFLAGQGSMADPIEADILQMVLASDAVTIDPTAHHHGQKKPTDQNNGQDGQNDLECTSHHESTASRADSSLHLPLQDSSRSQEVKWVS